MTFARDTDTDFLSVSPPIWRIQLKIFCAGKTMRANGLRLVRFCFGQKRPDSTASMDTLGQ